MIFLFNWVILRFYGNFRGCTGIFSLSISPLAYVMILALFLLVGMLEDERCNDNMRREFQACYDSCVTQHIWTWLGLVVLPSLKQT